MDALDRLAEPAADLLDRVDEILANGGAPAEHPIWPLLRRLRALPGAAVASVTALEPAPLTAAGDAVRTLVPTYVEVGSALAGKVEWEGAAGAIFTARRQALATHIVGTGESLAGRLAETAGYADAIADWIDRTRLDLARTLAGALGSAEAVTVLAERVADPSATGARAAAEIGARVLAAVATAYDEAAELPRRWAAAQAELTYRPPIDDDSGPDGSTRIAL